ncbi:hypothetical protein B0H14DRAFT_3678026 [Mycena olivaceomarginata]|nr:hypothetical protein B0H14DRAFT_3678026 [Mycena olivaceomarginata]
MYPGGIWRDTGANVQAELLNLLEEKTEPAVPCQIVTGSNTRNSLWSWIHIHVTRSAQHNVREDRGNSGFRSTRRRRPKCQIAIALSLATISESLDPSPFLFPMDLEREILETAARLDPQTMTSLVLVSRRVSEWWATRIDGIRYTTVTRESSRVLSRPRSTPNDSHFRGAGKYILAACTALRVFVAVTGNAKYLPASDDVRVVYDAWEYKDFRQGWLVETRGGLDFWARADTFVAKKRRGEIQPSLSW